MSSSLNSAIGEIAAPCARPRPAERGAAGPTRATANNFPDSHARRMLLLALASSPLLILSQPARASTAALAGLRRWGSGEYRRFGFLVYRATLWAGEDPLQPPLALRLDYERSIAGAAITEASVGEMRRFVDDPALLQTWGTQMRQIFPDVQPGDHLLGLYRPDGASFYQGERLLGAVTAPAFAAAFFAIWLDGRTSAPELRAALLTRPAG